MKKFGIISVLVISTVAVNIQASNYQSLLDRIDILRFEVGGSGPLFTYPTSEFSSSLSSYVKSLVKFVSDQGAISTEASKKRKEDVIRLQEIIVRLSNALINNAKLLTSAQDADARALSLTGIIDPQTLKLSADQVKNIKANFEGLKPFRTELRNMIKSADEGLKKCTFAACGEKFNLLRAAAEYVLEAIDKILGDKCGSDTLCISQSLRSLRPVIKNPAKA